MAATLIFKAKAARIHDAVFTKANRVFEAGTANQAHIAHLVQFMLKTECAGGRDGARVVFRSDVQSRGFARPPADD